MNNAPADIYVIGAQEVENSIPMSVTLNNSKAKMNKAIRTYFNASVFSLAKQRAAEVDFEENLCDNDHNLVYYEENPYGKDKEPKCNLCEKEIVASYGFAHCDECKYDLCRECAMKNS